MASELLLIDALYYISSSVESISSFSVNYLLSHNKRCINYFSRVQTLRYLAAGEDDTNNVFRERRISLTHSLA